MEFITNEKSKSLVVYEGFKFRFHKILENDVQRWPCCKLLLKTSVTNEIIEKNTLTTSMTDVTIPFWVVKSLIINQNEKQLEKICVRPFKVIIEIELRTENILGYRSKGVSLIRHRIHLSRFSVHSKLLKSSKEKITNTGEIFLIVNDEQSF